MREPILPLCRRLLPQGEARRQQKKKKVNRDTPSEPLTEPGTQKLAEPLLSVAIGDAISGEAIAAENRHQLLFVER
ncbi:MAG TPA: hypothetical protein VF753_19865 [Terriglobales bacterium]